MSICRTTVLGAVAVSMAAAFAAVPASAADGLPLGTYQIRNVQTETCVDSNTNVNVQPCGPATVWTIAPYDGGRFLIHRKNQCLRAAEPSEVVEGRAVYLGDCGDEAMWHISPVGEKNWSITTPFEDLMVMDYGTVRAMRSSVDNDLRTQWLLEKQ